MMVLSMGSIGAFATTETQTSDEPFVLSTDTQVEVISPSCTVTTKTTLYSDGFSTEETLIMEKHMNNLSRAAASGTITQNHTVKVIRSDTTIATFTIGAKFTYDSTAKTVTISNKTNSKTVASGWTASTWSQSEDSGSAFLFFAAWAKYEGKYYVRMDGGLGGTGAGILSNEGSLSIKVDHNGNVSTSG